MVSASLICDEELTYPTSAYGFSPDQLYPEYPFRSLAKEPNLVYRRVRDCLMQAGLDEEHVNTPAWNPLGKLIRRGSRVFVLCNFVYHRRNREAVENFHAKCTHGAVLRAVLDYVLLAVGDDGLVTFGNAPLQSCNWDRVLEATGAARALDFYRDHGCPRVKAVDLRLYVAERDSMGRLSKVDVRDDKSLAVEVDLGTSSLLEEFYRGGAGPHLRVTDYDAERTESFHGQGRHVYVVNHLVLDADVVVSVPKLKTHEKVGITCGLKGCVGVIGHKDCLAHHRLGSPRVDGDEYPQTARFLLWCSALHDVVNRRSGGREANTLRVVDRIVRKTLRVLGYNQAGNWYGNDTAWRMALDIARIVRYADAGGRMHAQPVRGHMVFTDGVVAGEGDGPLVPSPVPCGFLGFCDDAVTADIVNCLAMGFDPEKLPLVRRAKALRTYPLLSDRGVTPDIVLNGEHVSLSDLAESPMAEFIAPRGWIGRIERRGRAI